MKKNSLELNRLARIVSLLILILLIRVELSAQVQLVQEAFLEDGSFGPISGDAGVVFVPGDGVHVFVREGTNWSRQTKLIGSDITPGDNSYFGGVDISGDTVVVGAPYRGHGAAYVFVRSGTNWIQQARLQASNAPQGASDGEFGGSVAISGNTIVVGAWEDAARAVHAGAAYVFVRSETNWTEEAILYASNAQALDRFGQSVAISGNTIVVGSEGEDSNATGVNGNQNNNSLENAGAAYVFVRIGSTWTQQAYLKASNPGLQDCFGRPVAISDDTVVVGACCEDSNATGVNGNQTGNSVFNAGAAYVFARNGTNWSQQAYLKALEAPIVQESLSYWSAVSGNMIALMGTQGRSYVFAREGATWTPQTRIDSVVGGVDISGDILVVGRFVYRVVPPQPLRLLIEQSAESLLLSWPISAANYLLEQTTALASPPTATIWSEVAPPYQTNTMDISVTVPISTANKFFRLRKP